MSDAADDAFRRHYEAVYRFVRSRAPRPDAEDLTQEVFVAAVVALADARVESPPPLQWLYTVARRRLLDLARRRRFLPTTTAVDELDDASEHAYAPQLGAALAQAVSQLTEEQRQVVVPKLFEGFTLAEVAARLGTSEAACKMRLARGLAQLRRTLAEQGLEP